MSTNFIDAWTNPVAEVYPEEETIATERKIKENHLAILKHLLTIREETEKALPVEERDPNGWTFILFSEDVAPDQNEAGKLEIFDHVLLSVNFSPGENEEIFEIAEIRENPFVKARVRINKNINYTDMETEHLNYGENPLQREDQEIISRTTNDGAKSLILTRNVLLGNDVFLAEETERLTSVIKTSLDLFSNHKLQARIVGNSNSSPMSPLIITNPV